MLIALSGSHSVGKTELSKKITNHLNLKYTQHPFELVSNTSRRISKENNLKLNISHNKDFNSNLLQTKLMMEHDKIISTSSKNNIVQDRSIFDVLAYTICFHRNNQVNNKTLLHNFSYVKRLYQEYDMIIFLPINDNTKVVDDGARDLDMGFQKEINEILKDLIPSFTDEFFTCRESDWDKRDDEVLNFIDEIF